MKLLAPVVLASAVSAAPVVTEPVRRNSQELPESPVAPVQTATEPVELIDTDSLQLGDDESLEAYMDYLDDLPADEWEHIFDTLTTALEEKLGLNIDELEKLSDEEFDALLVDL